MIPLINSKIFMRIVIQRECADYDESGSIMELWGFDGGDYQKWQLIHVGDGYYKILSVQSGLAVCVDYGETDENEVALVQESYSSVNRKKWKITKSSSGGYILRPKSGESYNTDWCMCAGDQFLEITDGLNVEQKAYVNDNSYKDEWILHKIGSEVMLLSIISTEGSHDHISCYGDVMKYFESINYTEFNVINTDYISVANCIDQMELSNIFISRSHGGANSNSSWLKLFDTGTESRLYSYNIYDFSTSTALADLDEVEMMLYVGCTTAYGGNTANNLITASVNAGANYALGFKKEIDCNGANTWTSYFCEYYASGQTIYVAAQNASDDTASDHFVLNNRGNLYENQNNNRSFSHFSLLDIMLMLISTSKLSGLI